MQLSAGRRRSSRSRSRRPIQSLATRLRPTLPLSTPIPTTTFIDPKPALTMDVEAATAIRQAEVGAAKTMLDRTAEQFNVAPSRPVADAGYGSAGTAGLRPNVPHRQQCEDRAPDDVACLRASRPYDSRACAGRSARRGSCGRASPSQRSIPQWSRHDRAQAAQ